ncbi:unnamed protein product [Prorocentrum cordatum]|uniref:Uncharacterized protein n=1 Tax=Prorocentrum cordatum TaxID=2364126 RepID=A0ABN9QS88_9DINO|nr:unnamed protein product [Polarella glacialis]
MTTPTSRNASPSKTAPPRSICPRAWAAKPAMTTSVLSAMLTCEKPARTKSDSSSAAVLKFSAGMPNSHPAACSMLASATGPPAVAERPRGRAQEGGAGDEVVRAVHGDDTIHRGRRHCAKQAAHVPLAQRRPPLQDLGPEAPAGGLGLRRRQVEAEHPGGPEALQQPQHVVAAAAPRLQHHVPRRHARGLGNAVGERRCCLGVGHAVARPQAEVQPLGAPAAVQHAADLTREAATKHTAQSTGVPELRAEFLGRRWTPPLWRAAHAMRAERARGGARGGAGGAATLLARGARTALAPRAPSGGPPSADPRNLRGPLETSCSVQDYVPSKTGLSSVYSLDQRSGGANSVEA